MGTREWNSSWSSCSALAGVFERGLLAPVPILQGRDTWTNRAPRTSATNNSKNDTNDERERKRWRAKQSTFCILPVVPRFHSCLFWCADCTPSLSLPSLAFSASD
uniref:Uncharacterized protein n=1 Tax=Craspedostauros australis TaxID=1486917 RepID=A0A7R9WYB1_9STRA